MIPILDLKFQSQILNCSHLGFSLPLSTGMERLLCEQLAGERAHRRDEVRPMITQCSLVKVMMEEGSHHQMWCHSCGSCLFHLFTPKNLLVDLCRCGVAKVVGWQGIEKTSGGLFKTSSKKTAEQRKIESWCQTNSVFKLFPLLDHEIARMNFDSLFKPKLQVDQNYICLR